MASDQTNPPIDAISNAVSLLSAGLIAQAESAVNQSLSIYRMSPVLWNIRGACQAGQGRTKPAIADYRRAAVLNPGYAQALNNLGGAFKASSAFEDAIICFNRALGLSPELPEARTNLANSFFEAGDFANAVPAYESAIAANSQDGELRNNFGAALKETGDLRNAEKQLNKACELAPNLIEAKGNLGAVLTGLGKLDQAETVYRQTIEIRPDFIPAWRALGDLVRFEAGDPLITQMQGLYQQLPQGAPGRDEMCFALAKALDDLGDHEQSFRFLKEGNQLRRIELRYDPARDDELFRTIRQHLGNLSPSADQSNSGDSRELTPVFIVGMPRSGTTLVEQIIASHSQVFGAGELSFAEAGGMEFLREINIKSLGLEGTQAFADRYLTSVLPLANGEAFITDKAPGNFKWIGLILAAIPEAKILHVKRDPMATCWSIYRSYFTNRSLGYAWGLSDIARYYQHYQSLMTFWQERFSDRIIEMSYEQLVERPEEEMRQLISRIGLGWEDACLEFHKSSRPVQTTSAVQVRREIFSGSSDKWKVYQPWLQELEEGLRSA